MKWSNPTLNTERIEDTNPEIWIRSSEESLKIGDTKGAIEKINKAIFYANDKSHYYYEKLRILMNCSMYTDALDLICSKLEDFKRDFQGTDKLVQIDNYFEGAIRNCKRNQESLYQAANVLFNNKMFEKFVELLDDNIETIKSVTSNSNFELILEKYDKALRNINEKSLDFYITKIMLLYNYKSYNKFLCLVADKISSNLQLISNFVLEKLLNYVDDSLTKVNSKEKYEIIRIKILFSLGMYNNCIEIIYNNINYLLQQDKLYISNCLVECFIRDSSDNIESFRKMLILFDKNNYETFIQVVNIKLENFYNNVEKSEFDNILKYFYIAIERSSNISKAEAYQYIKVFLKYEKYDDFINLLEYSYHDFLDILSRNMIDFSKRFNKVQFNRVLDYFNKTIRNSYNDVEYVYNKIEVLFRYNRYEDCLNIFEQCGNYDFTEYIHRDINKYYDVLNDNQFNRLLSYFYKKVKTSSKNKENIYKNIKVLWQFQRFDLVIDLLEYKEEYDFMSEVEKELHIYKERLSDSQFDRVLKYFYSKIKSEMFSSKSNNYYILTKIKTLYNYGKFNECIELLSSCIDDIAKTLSENDYKEALRYLKSSYIKTGKFLSGTFKITLIYFKNAKKHEIFKGVSLLVIFALAWHFNLLYNIGILKPEIVDVKIIPDKNIMAPEELVNCKLEVTTKPKKVWNYSYQFKSDNEDVFKVNGVQIIGGKSEGNSDLLVTVKGKNQIDSKINLEVKKPIVNSIQLEDEKVSISIDEDKKINSTIVMNYEKAIMPSVKYTSTNNGVLKVDDTGKITGIASGNAEVIIEAGDKKQYLSVTVMGSSVENFQAYLDNNRIYVGETTKINIVLNSNKENSKLPRIKYLQDNSNISINQDGVVKGLRSGHTVITVNCGEKQKFITIEIVDKNLSYEQSAPQYISNDDFIFKYSDAKQLTGEELYNLDIKTLNIARNEIFARYGYVFQSKELQRYFESKRWYRPEPSYKGDNLNPIEDSNTRLLKQIEVIKIASQSNQLSYYSDYILPHSSNVKLTEEEVETLNDWEVILARNEIYARRGYIFGVPQLKRHFESKQWYSPNPYYNGEKLEPVEDYNIEVIKKIEEQRIYNMLKNQQ